MRRPDGTRVSDYDYALDPRRIARYPAERRDESRLLVISPGDEPFRHLRFRDVAELFQPGDVLVVNESRVLPARLLGRKPTGAPSEVLLLRPAPERGRRPPVGGAGPSGRQAQARAHRARRGRSARGGPRFRARWRPPGAAGHPAPGRGGARAPRTRAAPSLYREGRRGDRPGTLPDGVRAYPGLRRGPDGRAPLHGGAARRAGGSGCAPCRADAARGHRHLPARRGRRSGAARAPSRGLRGHTRRRRDDQRGPRRGRTGLGGGDDRGAHARVRSGRARPGAGRHRLDGPLHPAAILLPAPWTA